MKKNTNNRYRIYYRHRITNKIGYYETKQPRVSYDNLEQYLKTNNLKFLYMTNINGGLARKENQKKI